MTTSRTRTLLLACVFALLLGLVPGAVGTALTPAAGPAQRVDVTAGDPAAALKKKDKAKKPGKDKSAKPKKSKDAKGKKHADKKPKKQKVIPISDYTVAVTCTYDVTIDLTTCLISASGPNGPGKVKVLYVPAAVLCAPLTSGGAPSVEIESVPAFSSRKNKPDLAFGLVGRVTTAGTTTYWVEAGKQLLPVRGPGLACAPGPGQSAPGIPTPTPQPPQPTATPESATGTIEVRHRRCASGAGGDDYDWHRQCTDGAAGLIFKLKPTDADSPWVTVSTDATGTLRFDNLEPGRYRLILLEQNWCHAESDGVDENGDLVVEGNNITTVWAFTCDGI